MAWTKKTWVSSLLRKTSSASPLVCVSASPTLLERRTFSPSAFVESVQTATALTVLALAATTLLPRTPGISGLIDKTPFWYSLVITEALEQVTASDGSYVIVGDEYMDLVAASASGLDKKTHGGPTWQRLP